MPSMAGRSHGVVDPVQFELCIACRGLDPNRPQELLVHDEECSPLSVCPLAGPENGWMARWTGEMASPISPEAAMLHACRRPLPSRAILCLQEWSPDAALLLLVSPKPGASFVHGDNECCRALVLKGTNLQVCLFSSEIRKGDELLDSSSPRSLIKPFSCHLLLKQVGFLKF